MEKFFKLKEKGTTVRTEVIAGITTFLAMAYILAVNPDILGAAGMDKGAVFTATAISAAIATLIMGVYANYPVALAAGMGLNAYFAYTVSLGLTNQGVDDAWKIALTAVFVEGVIFVIISIFKFRETLVNAIPANLKYGITAGIGLFIAFIGFKNAGFVVGDNATLTTLGDIGTIQIALAGIGLLAICLLHHYKVRGAVLWGILGTWILGIIAQLTGLYKVNAAEGVYSLIPQFTSVSNILPPSVAPTFLKFDFKYVAENFMNFAVIVFAFLFVDIFDTVGTLVGVASKANLLDKDGKFPRAGRALMADAIGTVAGACLGTSTVTSYVESSAGVSEGGRTGLASVVTAGMFVLALFFSPIFLAIPGFATAPALVFVGLLMLSPILNMKFEGDMADVLGGFLAIVLMPFTSSIANGIMFSMLAWVIIKLITGKFKDIHPVMYVCAGLFVLRILSLVL